jgi:hypothetical protein
MIARRQYDIHAILAKMPNYRRKERDVRRVIDIDPNRWLQSDSGLASLCAEKLCFSGEEKLTLRLCRRLL